MRGSFQASVFRAVARSFPREGHPPACPISLGRHRNKQGSTGVSPVIETRMATSSMSNNASSLHGRDDHAPLFALPRGSARSRGARPPSGAVGCAPRPTCRKNIPACGRILHPAAPRGREAVHPRRMRSPGRLHLKLGTPTARRFSRRKDEGGSLPFFTRCCRTNTRAAART